MRQQAGCCRSNFFIQRHPRVLAGQEAGPAGRAPGSGTIGAVDSEAMFLEARLAWHQLIVQAARPLRSLALPGSVRMITNLYFALFMMSRGSKKALMFIDCHDQGLARGTAVVPGPPKAPKVERIIPIPLGFSQKSKSRNHPAWGRTRGRAFRTAGRAAKRVCSMSSEFDPPPADETA